MLRIGIIGAGTIATCHLDAYKKHPDCEIKAIADLNVEQAQKRAIEYGISDVYQNYQELLKDDTIDAVSIVTPPFTHKEIIMTALKSGKHVLCEKPPALNAEETQECVEFAKQCDKRLMFAFVCRFRNEVQYLKKFIDAGKMGKVMCAEATRLSRCDSHNGWFLKKSLSGGGPLRDGAIHEIDLALYLMGYPKPKTVLGFTSDVNKDLPCRVNGIKRGWVSVDKSNYERDIENIASGYVLFENGSCLTIKTSTIMHTVTQGVSVELSGEHAGARMEPFVEGKELCMVNCSEENYLQEFQPVLDQIDCFEEEIKHFIDCCANKIDCICQNEEAVRLMQIIDGLYLSAEKGEAVNL